MNLIGLPPQPVGVAWPTTAWPQGKLADTTAGSVRDAVDYAFSPAALPDLGQTHALVIIQGGRLLLERYADGLGPDQTYPSWSKAKSLTQALAGIAVGDGRLDIMAPADVPEWAGAGDRRGPITLDLLLRMSSGLAFVEDYEPDHPSDVIAMLFGQGKDDVAHYAASQTLAHAPGGFWSYSSGTSNIVSRCVARAMDAFGPDFETFMRARLFEPLGMTSAIPKFDAAGTFIGSSYCFCTARDFARFGLLYLRDGVWEGRRILPPGWVDYARTPTWQQPTEDGPYGAHWWLGLGGPGSFSANGFDGQYTVVVPDLDMVVVRHGATPLARQEAPRTWLGDLIGRFR
jgi:CubicO group peptidase (beta-lactamase class C family)